MSKGKSDQLFQLIKRMESAEKRHFKLFVKRTASSQNSLYLQVFNLLDKSKVYDAALLVKKIPNLKKQQLSNIKSNLLTQILTALRQFHRNKSIEITIREQLDFARLMYDKGLYQSSLEILSKAKKLAHDHACNILILEVIEFEKHIELQHITGSRFQKATLLTEETTKASEMNVRIHQLSSLSLNLYGLYLKYGFVKNEKDHAFITQFFNSNLPDCKWIALDSYSKLYLCQSHVWYANMTQDFLNYYRYAARWVKVFKDHPNLKSKEIAIYIKGLHNLLNALYLTQKEEKFLEAFEELKELHQQSSIKFNRNEESICTLFYYVHSLNIYYLQGRFSDGIVLVNPLVKIIESKKYNWDIHREMVFYYKIASLYFGSGQNEKAIDYLNLIINKTYPFKLRSDIQCFARILCLLAHYELGNELLVAYQIRSVYRFLAKMGELNQVQQEIFKFLRKTTKIYKKDIPQEFKKLKKSMLQIQKNSYEKRPFLYLDIISWLECKIAGVSVEQIIHQKYLKRKKTSK